MQCKKRLLTAPFRHYAAFIGIICGAIFFNSKALASFTPPTTSGGPFSCILYVSSIDYPTGPGLDYNPNGPCIYDDFYSNLFGLNTNWNCGREFTIAEYTGMADTFTFAYAGYYTSGDPLPVYHHNIQLWYNGTGTTASPSHLVNTWRGYADQKLDGTPNQFVLSSPYTDTPGEYTIKYYRGDGSADTAQPDIESIFVLQPQIQNIWIDAKPVCSDFSGTYSFQVHSTPELSTLIQPSQMYQNDPPSCNSGYENYIQLDFSGTTAFTGGINQSWNYGSVAGTLTSIPSIVPGDGWLNALTGVYAGTTYPTTADEMDLTDYSISGFVAADYGITLSGSSGTNPVINLVFSDGIRYNESLGTGITLNVPIIIEYPVSITLPGTPGTPVGPPHATGVPFQSYDVYDYTVSGSETWTPTNNPIANMYVSGGSTIDSIIRIQDNLTIPAGAELDLQNMRLEMGPGATIVVAPGGNLTTLGITTLTAYRGCVDQSGTDASTWSGITLNGDLSDGLGYLLLGGTTVSYADVGVQNGTASSSGGYVYMVGDTFYNNKAAMQVWPVSATTFAAHAQSCTFKNDGNAYWFASDGFVNANPASTFNFDNCKFINNTGAIMPAAISGFDATLAADACTFGSPSVSNNFQDAILVTAASGAGSLIVINDTFNNNQVSAAVYGAIAPLFTGNVFNLPEYLRPGGSVYPGSGIAVVPDQVIGALMQGTSAYTIMGNFFQTTVSAVYDQSGTLEYNTGSDNNLVTDNTFTGIGVAMNSNFFNNDYAAGTGLQYVCNTDTRVKTDISVLGFGDGSFDGINPVQATGFYTTDPYPAGNVFGSATSNIYNTEAAFTYDWYGLDASQYPAYLVSANPVTVTSLSSPAECGVGSGGSTSRMAGHGATHAADGSNDNSATVNYAIAARNLNHYMTDSIAHRDSIYYWAAQLNSPYGDLLTTNLLIEDSLIDSANAVYGGIISKYSLDSAEANDFTQGQYLENILVSLKENGGNILSLTSSQVTTLQSIVANSSMWAHARAEGWLHAINGTPIIDSLLYPILPASTDTSSRYVNPNTPHQAASYSPDNKVYPNPVQNALQVMYTATTNNAIEIQIQDIAGQVIITQSLQSGVSASVDMSALAPGIYLYRILEGANATMIGKVAKD